MNNKHLLEYLVCKLKLFRHNTESYYRARRGIRKLKIALILRGIKQK
jgi:hypothetical protein